MIGREDVVFVSGGAYQGTGFLVGSSTGVVLITVLHVAVGLQPEPLSFPKTITCKYCRKDGTTWDEEIEWDTENEPNLLDDWVAIRVRQYENTKRWNLAELVPSLDEPNRRWSSYGFPYDQGGMGIVGTVVTTGAMAAAYPGTQGIPASSDDDRQAPVLQLSVNQMHGEGAVPANGFSGAPIVIDGFVVGVFRSFYPRQGNEEAATHAAGGSTFAIPIQRIAAVMGLRCTQLWTSADREACALLDLKEAPSLKEKHSRLDDAPSELLRADSQTVLFEASSRSTELNLLDAFIEGHEPYLILAAKGGTGKTRLLIEYCHRLRSRGWMAGFVPSNSPGDLVDFLHRLCAGQVERLLVFDYVETTPYIAGKIIARVARQRHPKTRVVLLSRDSPTPSRPLWWERLLAVSGVPRHERAWIELAPLYEDPEDRRRGFELALTSFHGDVPKPFPDLSNPLLARPLYLYAVALLSAKEEAAHVSKLDGHGILSEILRHERNAWTRWFERDSIGPINAVPTGFYRAMDALLVVATLIGPVSQDLALALAEKCVDALDRHDLFAASRCIREIYGEGEIRPLEPDLLGEQLIHETLERGRVEDWLDVVVGSDRSMAQLSRALVIFSRLARVRADAKNWSWVLLSKHAKMIIGRISAWHPMENDGDARESKTYRVDSPGLALERVAREVVNPSLAAQLIKSIPEKTLELLELAILLEEVLIEEERGRETRSKALAVHLLNLGGRLAALGRRREAVHASREATQVLREMVGEDISLAHEFVAALNNLGMTLFDVGEHQEARLVTEECIDACRTFKGDAFDSAVPILAYALGNLAMILTAPRDLERARTAAQEAVEIWRSRREAMAESFRASELARVLTIMAEIESQEGRHTEALANAEESVSLYREMIRENPDGFQPELHSALITYGKVLHDNRRQHEARRITEESIALLRRMASERPDTFNDKLSVALSNLSNAHAELGELDAALQAMRESLTLLRALSSHEPRAFLGQLGKSLLRYGELLNAAGSREAALEATSEAIGIHRRLVDEDFPSAAPMLASALRRVHGLRKVTSPKEALSAIREAVGLYRVLAYEEESGVYLSFLASALHQLADDLYGRAQRQRRWVVINRHLDPTLSDDLVEAFFVAREALVILRRLATQQPKRFLLGLAQALVTVALLLGAIGAAREGVSCASEAVEILRGLRERDDAHVVMLADALRELSFLLGSIGSLEMALEHARESVGLLKQSTVLDPNVTTRLMLSLCNFGTLLHAEGRSTEALSMLRESITALRGSAWSSFVLPQYQRGLSALEILLRETGMREELKAVQAELNALTPRQLGPAGMPRLAFRGTRTPNDRGVHESQERSIDALVGRLLERECRSTAMGVGRRRPSRQSR